MGLRAVTAAAAAARARVMSSCRPGMRPFGGGGKARVGEQGGEAGPAAARVFSASRTAAFAWSRAGLRISLVFVSMLEATRST